VKPQTSAEGAAFGKVILFGEHAVVYGAPAIAAGLPRGARAIATWLGRGPSTMRIGARTVAAGFPADEDLGRAIAALLDVPPAIGPVHVVAQSDLPPGGGLGSSAALSVAIARAVEELAFADVDPAVREARALERAAAWERVFHGNPSGIDATAAAHGGVFRFVRGQGTLPLAPKEDLLLCVGFTGHPSSTRTTVGLVAAQREKDPALVQRSIDAITSIVNNAALAIEAGEQTALGELMNMNQLVLSGLFVSTSEIEELCAIARSCGALGAKLTGGGGGGSVIALVPPARRADGTRDHEREAEHAARILDGWREASRVYEGFVARIPGSRRERANRTKGGGSR